ncbi:MAG: hypothetical protein IPJ49_05330 [Candidatus Obscuribacter sp.]|nr:hypothetical protein [Candidatus Obscuribacter sp.]
MVLADTLAIFLVVVGVMVSLPGLWLLCRGLWPHAVATSTASLSGGLVKAFLTGIPLAIVATILAAVLSKVPSLGGALVVLVISVFVIYASVGIAGWTSVGQNCPPRVTMIAPGASPCEAALSWYSLSFCHLLAGLSFCLLYCLSAAVLPLSISSRQKIKVSIQLHQETNRHKL